MINHYGAVACGHSETAHAAESILREGGNAFDAIVAAHFVACIAEPVLASLGGGGFLLAKTKSKSLLYDFFAHTPQQIKSNTTSDFYPIIADFGNAQQEFHIGLGTIAIPGIVKGMFEIQKDLCRMPMRDLIQPAVSLARQGVLLNEFQSYIFRIIHPILLASPESRSIYGSNKHNLLNTGDIFKLPQFADTLEALAIESDRLFYQGDLANSLLSMCKDKSHLSAEDLAQYRVIKRQPLKIAYRNAQLLTNPPPSSGGLLIGFALKALESIPISQYQHGSPEHLELLALVMELTNIARIEQESCTTNQTGKILDATYLRSFQQQIQGRAQSFRGTTHMSIIDKLGNCAGLTVSNGEGCGHILPGTGIMLNNMLGEEDLNPDGFHQWQVNQRMTSMMAPSMLLLPNGRNITLGSGGSNRLRTAILQTLINIIDFKMNINDAVIHSRIHCEGQLLNIEPGFTMQNLKSLLELYPNHKLWDEKNLFFGGVHTVSHNANGFDGIGDPRRGGIFRII